MKRTGLALAAALVATMMASQVMAQSQTTVTSSGREGPTTCVGEQEIDAANMPITALSTSSVTVTVPQTTWSAYVGRFGDGGRPTGSASVGAAVFNAKTGSRRGGAQSFAFISSGTPTFAGGSRTISGLAEKSVYYVEYYVAKSGFDTVSIARRCFMTGGTYSFPAHTGSLQTTTGCFAISPRTREDVRNCWCGRRNTVQLFSDNTANGNFLDSVGCR